VDYSYGTSSYASTPTQKSVSYDAETTISPQDIAAQWTQVRGKMRAELGEAAFRSWVKPLTLASVDAGHVKMTVPTRFIRDWILSRYGDRLISFWKEQNPLIRSMEIVIAANTTSMRDDMSYGEDSSDTAMTPSYNEEDDLPNGLSAQEDSGKITTKLDPRFTFDNFVVGKPNELAFAAARRVAEADQIAFNPLFVYGGVGLGKTHLIHAIAWSVKHRDPSKKVMYVSAEKFMYQFIRALRSKDTMSFKEQFRSVDLLLIDDLQFISGKDATQEEFFHTFNALIDQNCQVVISADRAPSDLEGLGERLRSRLGWGLVVDLHPSTYDLRLGILESKAHQMKADVPSEVLEFLSSKITASVRELEGALNRIVAHASLVGRQVTLENTQEVLQDLLRASDRKVSIEEIQKRVAEHFNIRLSDMHSARRSRTVARPRQIAMALSKQLTQRSLPEIGRKFGGRDHTTVIHAVRKVEELCSQDATFAEDVTMLRRILEG